jgi:crotonobetainyl-CoA:carnitine CoA-transferase CaiB-like acyl-CoA transferase
MGEALNISKSALDGVVVIDASRVLAGPFAGQILGDHGAEVIKVESYDGDDTRGYGPPFINGDAPYFLGLNRNKKNLALNLSDANGIAALFTMLESADVLIENFKASTWAKWGISDLSQLTEQFPRLVHCRISGFGETGDLGGLPGYDAAIQAISGLMSVNGDPAVSSARIGIPLVDTSTGMNAAMGIMFALFERERSQKGQCVEVTLFDTAVALLHPHTANVLNGGQSVRTGNGHPNIVPYDLFPTKTTQLFIAIGNDRQFGTLCETLGDMDLAKDSRYKTNKDRVINRVSLTERLNELLSGFDGMKLFTDLMAVGVPCSPVLTVEEALDLPHSKHRQMTVNLGQYHGVGIPIKLKRTPGSVRLPPAHIGEHSEEVLQRFGIDANITT